MKKKIAHLSVCLIIVVFSTGCIIFTHTGPPQHAKAYGYNKQYIYHYYPDYEIYFDVVNETYIILKDNDWIIVNARPQFLNSSISYVVINSDVQRPWLNHSLHKKQYPGNKSKLKGKKK